MGLPLVTKSDGAKFGKTENGTVWLDAKKTTPFQFFQFWLNQSDDDIEKLMLWFSLKSIEEIKEILLEDEQAKANGKKPMAQTILAKEMVSIVHGDDALNSVLSLQEAFFKKDLSSLTDKDFEMLKNEPEFFVFKKEELLADFPRAVVDMGMASSKTEVRRFIKGKALRINNDLVEDIDVSSFNLKKFNIIQRGKKVFSIVQID